MTESLPMQSNGCVPGRISASKHWISSVQKWNVLLRTFWFMCRMRRKISDLQYSVGSGIVYAAANLFNVLTTMHIGTPWHGNKQY